MRSCLYTGRLRHRRFAPRSHQFAYRLFMVCLDLEELPDVFERRLFWSARRPALAWFRRADHLGDPETPLPEAVRALVGKRLGKIEIGRIELLTHLRYFGVLMNPVSFYFCYAPGEDRLQAVVLDVTNTPWGERHQYVVDCRAGRHDFAKEFHVSPFLPMDMEYRLHVRKPGRRCTIHLENWREDRRVFDATLTLERREISSTSLTWVLARYPAMTAQVVLAIYWQALRLWRKGMPFYPHAPQGKSLQEVGNYE